MLISTIKLNWYEARSKCIEFGAKLAEIDSAAKQTAIDASVSSTDRLWIGLNDIAQEGRFVWDSTGQPAVYTNWGRASPSNSNNENCVMVTHNIGLWIDGQCTGLEYFVCEKP